MASLIGNKPNQVPTNGDLGTLAFQDANAVNITGGVVDVSAGTAALPTLGTTGDPDTGVFFPAANTVAVSTNGTERMRINSSGNLLIGTSAAFDVSKVVSVGDYGVIRSSNGTTASPVTDKALSYVMGNNQVYANISFLNTITSNNASWMTFNVTPTTSTTPFEAMRIDSSGNVGIGASSPAAKLYISGTGNLLTTYGNSSSNVVSDFQIIRTSSSTLIQQAPSITFSDSVTNNTRTIQNGSGNLQFYAYRSAWIEDMRIDSSGNLLVGTTSGGGERMRVVAASNSTYTLQVRSDSSGDVAQAPLFVSKYDNNSTTSQVFQRFAINAGGTANGQINANGASQVAFGSWSDSRLKENIVDLPSQIENITALRPVEFDYKAGGHQIGFIAQEMKEVYPDAVGEDSEGMMTITGWDKTTARLVKAIQEQQALIEELKAKVAALEAA